MDSMSSEPKQGQSQPKPPHIHCSTFEKQKLFNRLCWLFLFWFRFIETPLNWVIRLDLRLKIWSPFSAILLLSISVKFIFYFYSLNPILLLLHIFSLSLLSMSVNVSIEIKVREFEKYHYSIFFMFSYIWSSYSSLYRGSSLNIPLHRLYILLF